MIFKVISSAESPAEQAALEAAIEAGIDYGGWTCLNKSIQYRLKKSSLKAERRIEQNLFDADGTAIFYAGKMDNRAELSRKISNRHGYPCAHFDLSGADAVRIASDLRTWAHINNVRKLYFVGPKAIDGPAFNALVKAVIIDAVSPCLDLL